jgi:hypothetical protein
MSETDPAEDNVSVSDEARQKRIQELQAEIAWLEHQIDFCDIGIRRLQRRERREVDELLGLPFYRLTTFLASWLSIPRMEENNPLDSMTANNAK